MQNWKSLAISLLVVTAGVLVALKVKEQMDKSKVSAPIKK